MELRNVFDILVKPPDGILIMICLCFFLGEISLEGVPSDKKTDCQVFSLQVSKKQPSLMACAFLYNRYACLVPVTIKNSLFILLNIV